MSLSVVKPDGSLEVVAEKNKRWVGTAEEWEQFKTDYPDKVTEYEIVCISNDMDTGEVVDALTNGDMRAVTSNAVYDAINNIQTGTAVNGEGMSSAYHTSYAKIGKIVVVEVIGLTTTGTYSSSRVIASGLPKPAYLNYADGVCCILNNMVACGVTVSSNGELLVLPVVTPPSDGGYIRGSFTYVTSE